MSDLTFAQLAELEAAGAPFILATVTAAKGSTPRGPGARMAILAEAAVGSVGGGAVERATLEAGREMLRSGEAARVLELNLAGDLGMCCGGRMTLFLDRCAPPPRLWIFGAGHIGAALAPAALAAGLRVTVVDGRADWADPRRFPSGVELRDAEPEDLLGAAPIPAEDLAVVVTHDHPLDESLIRRLLSQPEPPRFVGLVGSRRKWARFRERLLARGLSAEQLDSVRCPVGLDIGARSPAEIAVSIVAQLISARRDALSPLSDSP